MNRPRVVVYPTDVERHGSTRRIAVVRLPDGSLRCLDCDACAPWEGELSPVELAQAHEGIERELSRLGRQKESVMRSVVGPRLLSRVLDDLEEHSAERLPVHADELRERLGVDVEELRAALDTLEDAGWLKRDTAAPTLIWLEMEPAPQDSGEPEPTVKIERCALAGALS
ncbi:hypothetical protein [Sorangium sp. So ce362]|uniref:hypothetical protein n=1 Tax=Sorangium sp. So ce362 TaxID=3133303 RepID=UPI003F636411